MAETETLTIFLEMRPRRAVGTFRDHLETETSRPRPRPWAPVFEAYVEGSVSVSSGTS